MLVVNHRNFLNTLGNAFNDFCLINLTNIFAIRAMTEMVMPIR